MKRTLHVAALLAAAGAAYFAWTGPTFAQAPQGKASRASKADRPAPNPDGPRSRRDAWAATATRLFPRRNRPSRSARCRRSGFTRR